jgi:adiponectin receptor
MFVLAALGIESVFLCSSLYHTMGCVSDAACSFYSKFDYTAIAVKIACGGTPILYTAFYCTPMLQLLYITLSYVLGAATVVVMFHDKFSHARYQKVRTAVFVGLGTSFLVPMVHRTLFVLPAFDPAVVWRILAMGAVFVGGALLYAHHLPERWFPRATGRERRWIDHIGHSHSIFHVCVVIGGYLLVTIPFRMFADMAEKSFACEGSGEQPPENVTLQ